MGPAQAWVADEISEENCFRKLKKTLLLKRSFLAVLYPIVFIAKLTGISGISIHYNHGRYTCELSSKLLIRYSYGTLISSIVYQTVPMYFYYKQYNDMITLMYLVMRTLITTAIHYSMLYVRKPICQLLQNEHDLGIEIPGIFTLIPVVAYISTFLVSIITTKLVHAEMTAFLGAILDLRPPIFNLYGCFVYGCQAFLLIEALNNVNSDLRKFAKNPGKSKSLRPIMEQYLLLRQVCREINQSMGMLMLLTSMAVSCEIVYSSFLSCVATHISIVATSTTWLLLHVIPGTLTILTCQHVETTFRKGKAIAMEIQLREFSPAIQDEARELQVQLLQLPMSFSALGWFSLNGDQLQTAFAALIRYTVILVQNIRLDLDELLPMVKNTTKVDGRV